MYHTWLHGVPYAVDAYFFFLDSRTRLGRCYSYAHCLITQRSTSRCLVPGSTADTVNLPGLTWFWLLARAAAALLVDSVPTTLL